jgi:hypothetical protein
MSVPPVEYTILPFMEQSPGLACQKARKPDESLLFVL